jgi:hypothetical protein
MSRYETVWVLLNPTRSAGSSPLGQAASWQVVPHSVVDRQRLEHSSVDVLSVAVVQLTRGWGDGAHTCRSAARHEVTDLRAGLPVEGRGGPRSPAAAHEWWLLASSGQSCWAGGEGSFCGPSSNWVSTDLHLFTL